MIFSQTYPVQTFIQVSPPHTSYLPDYTDPFSNQMKVFLTLTDFTVPSYQVKLRFTFTGNGYSITTSSLLPLPVTTLSPGTPVEISGSDLAPYLSSQNLTFTGIDVTDYELRKVLPEGPCQICVEVIDFSNPNQAVLSNPACTQVWFSFNDPPLLNTPFCGTQITPSDPQQIIFSWSPLHMNSLHSAGTQYVFELFEIRPDGADANQVVNSSLPIFMQVTDQTMINYGITEPQLQVGMSYAWRVKAQDIQGRDFFRNNGYSTVCTFTYGNIAESLADGITLNLNSSGTGTRMGYAWWNVSANFTHYKLEVRKTGNPDYAWFPFQSTTGDIKIYQLEPSTQYECRVKGCINDEYESEWSNISVFTTQPIPNYNCGSTTLPPGEINYTPLTNAIVGMTFTVGQFEMFVTDIHPLNPITLPGHYNGTGTIAVAFLYNIRVSFEDILVDDNLLMRQGKVEAITEGVDAWMEDQQDDVVMIPGVIDSISFPSDSTVLITFGEFTLTFEFPENGPLVVQDESGLIYTINQDGTYTVTNGFYIELSEFELFIMDMAVDTIASLINSDTLNFLESQRENYYDQMPFDLLASSPGEMSSNDPSMLFFTESTDEFSDRTPTESETQFHYYDQQYFIKSVTVLESQRFKSDQNYSLLIRDIKIADQTILEFIATSLTNDLTHEEISYQIANAIIAHFETMLNDYLSFE